jgi:soluble lytic murein transglycosylase-like protein
VILPRWARDLDKTLIDRIAVNHGLDPKIVIAIVHVESLGNSNAIRYEPNFKWFKDPHKLAKTIGCTLDTMVFMQKNSWGLMQVMGAVAYEHGLDREADWNRRWATALTNPSLGLNYGCRHLKVKFEKYGPDPALTYAAYNAGSVRYGKDGSLVNEKSVERFCEAFDKL